MILYVYFGYPVLLYILSLIRKKRVRKEHFYPAVSIIISAYNEEKAIGDKINSLLALEYPKTQLEILIGSDGSTDKTVEIISRYTNENIQLYPHSERQGKPSMLNRLALNATGEILVFTDARQRIDKNALKELVANFSDPTIGCVSAELLFVEESNNAAQGINLYWNYEKLLRNYESKIGSMLGATGAMYAIRKELLSELPKDLILDDVYIPLKIIEKGYRAIFEPLAKIYDRPAKEGREEFSRKVRTLAGNFQIFAYFKKLFNPFKSPISLQLFSHKFLRLMVPFLLLTTFLSNCFALDNNFYKIILMLQIIFYIFAFIGLVSKITNRIFNIPYMFCVMNAAAVAGFYRFLTHKQDILWQKAGIEN